MTYTLGGTDAASFSIVKGTGQLQTKAALDKEEKDTYMVTVTATDPSGLSATVNVTIKVTNVDEPPVIMRAPDANVAPEFASATTSRTVAENTAAGEDIGNPVAANDANGDTLTYALGGTDAASPSTSTSATGQLMTKAALDYETKGTYEVMVTASDSGGLSDSIDVTITVTNEDELGMLVGQDSVGYMENDTGAVGTYTADGPVTPTWSLEGDDSGAFTIGGSSGELMFASPPDFEAPADMGMDNMYQVTVKAEAGGEMDMMDVTITVTNEDELGMLVGQDSVGYMENGTGAVGTYTADGPVTPTWSLEGDDSGAFTIGGSSGELMFASPPDFEAPADMGMDNMYQVTVKAEAGGEMDMMDVTITVTNVDEPGMVTLWAGTDALTMAPQVGETITGAVMDPDGNPGDMPPIVMDTTINDVTWQWAKTKTPDMMESWMPITDATDAAYTVMDADEGYHLRATAMYADGEGMGKMASMPTMMVTTTPEFADSEDGARSVAENTGAGMEIGAPVTATDANGDARWTTP